MNKRFIFLIVLSLTGINPVNAAADHQNHDGDTVSLSGNKTINKPPTMACIKWLRQLEGQRSSLLKNPDVAQKKEDRENLKALSQEIAATIGGKYGISSTAATPDEAKKILESIAINRMVFMSKANVMREYLAYQLPDSSEAELLSKAHLQEIAQKSRIDQSILERHLAAIATADAATSWWVRQKLASESLIPESLVDVNSYIVKQAVYESYDNIYREDLDGLLEKLPDGEKEQLLRFFKEMTTQGQRLDPILPTCLAVSEEELTEILADDQRTMTGAEFILGMVSLRDRGGQEELKTRVCKKFINQKNPDYTYLGYAARILERWVEKYPNSAQKPQWEQLATTAWRKCIEIWERNIYHPNATPSDQEYAVNTLEKFIEKYKESPQKPQWEQLATTAWKKLIGHEKTTLDQLKQAAETLERWVKENSNSPDKGIREQLAAQAREKYQEIISKEKQGGL